MASCHCHRLFELAGNGIVAGENPEAKIGLTKKQYYSSLHKLLESDLIMKVDGIYRRTALGEKIADAFAQIEKIDPTICKMVDVLRKSKKIAEDDIAKVLSVEKS